MTGGPKYSLSVVDRSVFVYPRRTAYKTMRTRDLHV